MTNRAKPKVWVVDDREENRTRFSQSHSAEFDVTTFENPDQLLRAIRTDRPDALLCDIFFYANAEDREAKEARVPHKAQQIEPLPTEFGPHPPTDAIRLTSNFRHQFRYN